MVLINADSEVEAWMQEVSMLVADSITPQHADLGFLFNWSPPAEHIPRWTLRVTEKPTQLIGGRQDGGLLVFGFTLDISKLLMLLEAHGPFTALLSCLVLSSDDDDADDDVPRLLLVGAYQGHELAIAVCTEPFQDTPVGQLLHPDGHFSPYAGDHGED
jgi:hypothetical protein